MTEFERIVGASFLAQERRELESLACALDGGEPECKTLAERIEPYTMMRTTREEGV